jgi:bifunctional non-homologous end joining protein LigD
LRKTSAKSRTTKPAAAPAAAGSLEAYREKRDPARTTEPFGPERKRSATGTRSARFVIHLHDATRTHYDLRLEYGGTLASFAVPKGPSLDPVEKRLAVRTEDHPIEYLEFEDVIPEGSYGAGPMIVWDTGRVTYLETTAEEGLAKGKVDFELSGYKVRGRFALVASGRRRGEDAQWLLIKKADAWSRPGGEPTTEDPFSVLSGLRIDELATRGDVALDLETQAERLGAPRAELDARHLVPMLCATTGAKLDDPDRLYELKLDGVRIVADRRGESVSLRYRNGRAATGYSDVARAVRALAPGRLVLDGEVIAFDERGRPSFERIAPRIHARRPLDIERAVAEVPVVYLVFDILQIGERSLVSLPLRDRKALLMKLVRGRGLIRVLDHLEGDGRPLWELCTERRLEGVVAKRASSPYRPGPRRSDDWVKLKCERDEDFVVVGWVDGKGGRQRLGALALGSYENRRLVYRGKVGSGLNEKVIGELLERLRALEVDKNPAHGEPPREAGRTHFVRPELVVSVRYLDWTEDGHLRAPVFRGLRQDVSAASCTVSPGDAALDKVLEEEPPSALPSADEPAAAAEVTAETVAPRVVVKNRSKVFWPDEGYTKGDLLDYYARVAPVMLPFLRGRPVVLVRYPDGIAGKSFYQWRAPPGTPKWIRTLELYDEDKQEARGTDKSVFLVDDADGLVHLANLGAIPLHVLASRETSAEACDFLTLDLDIGQQPFRRAVELALSLRKLLGELELVGYPKTSGQKGLHVLVPLGPGIGFETAKILVELIGRLLVSRHHDVSTMERRVSKRGAKLYVDTGQTGTSRTIVAPYSVRAHAGATVSTPLRWEEVHGALDPTRFTIVSVPTRVREIGDPMAGLLDERPDVPRAVERLEKLLQKAAG